MSATEVEQSFASTTWQWKRVKMRRPAGGPSSTPPKASSRLSRWRPRSPLTITVRYHGGPEAWWCIKARGCEFRFPGHTALHDVMRAVMNNDLMS